MAATPCLRISGQALSTGAVDVVAPVWDGSGSAIVTVGAGEVKGLSAASGKLSLDASVPWLSEGGTPTVIRQFDAQLDRAALLLASGSSLATVVMDSPGSWSTAEFQGSKASSTVEFSLAIREAEMFRAAMDATRQDMADKMAGEVSGAMDMVERAILEAKAVRDAAAHAVSFDSASLTEAQEAGVVRFPMTKLHFSVVASKVRACKGEAEPGPVAALLRSSPGVLPMIGRMQAQALGRMLSSQAVSLLRQLLHPALRSSAPPDAVLNTNVEWARLRQLASVVLATPNDLDLALGALSGRSSSGAAAAPAGEGAAEAADGASAAPAAASSSPADADDEAMMMLEAASGFPHTVHPYDGPSGGYGDAAAPPGSAQEEVEDEDDDGVFDQAAVGEGPSVDCPLRRPSPSEPLRRAVYAFELMRSAARAVGGQGSLAELSGFLLTRCELLAQAGYTILPPSQVAGIPDARSNGGATTTARMLQLFNVKAGISIGDLRVGLAAGAAMTDTLVPLFEAMAPGWVVPERFRDGKEAAKGFEMDAGTCLRVLAQHCPLKQTSRATGPIVSMETPGQPRVGMVAVTSSDGWVTAMDVRSFSLPGAAFAFCPGTGENVVSAASHADQAEAEAAELAPVLDDPSAFLVHPSRGVSAAVVAAELQASSSQAKAQAARFLSSEAGVAESVRRLWLPSECRTVAAVPVVAPRGGDSRAAQKVVGAVARAMVAGKSALKAARSFAVPHEPAAKTPPSSGAASAASSPEDEATSAAASAAPAPSPATADAAAPAAASDAGFAEFTPFGDDKDPSRTTVRWVSPGIRVQIKDEAKRAQPPSVHYVKSMMDSTTDAAYVALVFPDDYSAEGAEVDTDLASTDQLEPVHPVVRGTLCRVIHGAMSGTRVRFVRRDTRPSAPPALAAEPHGGKGWAIVQLPGASGPPKFAHIPYGALCQLHAQAMGPLRDAAEARRLARAAAEDGRAASGPMEAPLLPPRDPFAGALTAVVVEGEDSAAAVHLTVRAERTPEDAAAGVGAPAAASTSGSAAGTGGPDGMWPTPPAAFTRLDAAGRGGVVDADVVGVAGTGPVACACPAGHGSGVIVAREDPSSPLTVVWVQSQQTPSRKPHIRGAVGDPRSATEVLALEASTVDLPADWSAGSPVFDIAPITSADGCDRFMVFARNGAACIVECPLETSKPPFVVTSFPAAAEIGTGTILSLGSCDLRSDSCTALTFRIAERDGSMSVRTGVVSASSECAAGDSMRAQAESALAAWGGHARDGGGGARREPLECAILVRACEAAAAHDLDSRPAMQPHTGSFGVRDGTKAVWTRGPGGPAADAPLVLQMALASAAVPSAITVTAEAGVGRVDGRVPTWQSPASAAAKGACVVAELPTMRGTNLSVDAWVQAGWAMPWASAPGSAAERAGRQGAVGDARPHSLASGGAPPAPPKVVVLAPRRVLPSSGFDVMVLDLEGFHSQTAGQRDTAVAMEVADGAAAPRPALTLVLSPEGSPSEVPVLASVGLTACMMDSGRAHIDAERVPSAPGAYVLRVMRRGEVVASAPIAVGSAEIPEPEVFPLASLFGPVAPRGAGAAAHAEQAAASASEALPDMPGQPTVRILATSSGHIVSVARVVVQRGGSAVERVVAAAPTGDRPLSWMEWAHVAVSISDSAITTIIDARVASVASGHLHATSLAWSADGSAAAEPAAMPSGPAGLRGTWTLSGLCRKVVLEVFVDDDGAIHAAEAGSPAGPPLLFPLSVRGGSMDGSRLVLPIWGVNVDGTQFWLGAFDAELAPSRASAQLKPAAGTNHSFLTACNMTRLSRKRDRSGSQDATARAAGASAASAADAAAAAAAGTCDDASDGGSSEGGDSGTYSLVLGADGSGHTWVGSLMEARVWSSALSPDELRGIRASSSAALVSTALADKLRLVQALPLVGSAPEAGAIGRCPVSVLLAESGPTWIPGPVPSLDAVANFRVSVLSLPFSGHPLDKVSAGQFFPSPAPFGHPGEPCGQASAADEAAASGAGGSGFDTEGAVLAPGRGVGASASTAQVLVSRQWSALGRCATDLPPVASSSVRIVVEGATDGSMPLVDRLQVSLVGHGADLADEAPVASPADTVDTVTSLLRTAVANASARRPSFSGALWDALFTPGAAARSGAAEGSAPLMLSLLQGSGALASRAGALAIGGAGADLEPEGGWRASVDALVRGSSSGADSVARCDALAEIVRRAEPGPASVVLGAVMGSLVEAVRDPSLCGSAGAIQGMAAVIAAGFSRNLLPGLPGAGGGAHAAAEAVRSLTAAAAQAAVLASETARSNPTLPALAVVCGTRDRSTMSAAVTPSDAGMWPLLGFSRRSARSSLAEVLTSSANVTLGPLPRHADAVLTRSTASKGAAGVPTGTFPAMLEALARCGALSLEVSHLASGAEVWVDLGEECSVEAVNIAASLGTAKPARQPAVPPQSAPDVWAGGWSVPSLGPGPSRGPTQDDDSTAAPGAGAAAVSLDLDLFSTAPVIDEAHDFPALRLGFGGEDYIAAPPGTLRHYEVITSTEQPAFGTLKKPHQNPLQAGQWLQAKSRDSFAVFGAPMVGSTRYRFVVVENQSNIDGGEVASGRTPMVGVVAGSELSTGRPLAIGTRCQRDGDSHACCVVLRSGSVVKGRKEVGKATPTKLGAAAVFEFDAVTSTLYYGTADVDSSGATPTVPDDVELEPVQCGFARGKPVWPVVFLPQGGLAVGLLEVKQLRGERKLAPSEGASARVGSVRLLPGAGEAQPKVILVQSPRALPFAPGAAPAGSFRPQDLGSAGFGSRSSSGRWAVRTASGSATGAPCATVGRYLRLKVTAPGAIHRDAKLSVSVTPCGVRGEAAAVSDPAAAAAIEAESTAAASGAGGVGMGLDGDDDGAEAVTEVALRALVRADAALAEVRAVEADAKDDLRRAVSALLAVASGPAAREAGFTGVPSLSAVPLRSPVAPLVAAVRSAHEALVLEAAPDAAQAAAQVARLRSAAGVGEPGAGSGLPKVRTDSSAASAAALAAEAAMCLLSLGLRGPPAVRAAVAGGLSGCAAEGVTLLESLIAPGLCSDDAVGAAVVAVAATAIAGSARAEAISAALHADASGAISGSAIPSASASVRLLRRHCASPQLSVQPSSLVAQRQLVAALATVNRAVFCAVPPPPTPSAVLAHPVCRSLVDVIRLSRSSAQPDLLAWAMALLNRGMDDGVRAARAAAMLAHRSDEADVDLVALSALIGDTNEGGSMSSHQADDIEAAVAASLESASAAAAGPAPSPSDEELSLARPSLGRSLSADGSRATAAAVGALMGRAAPASLSVEEEWASAGSAQSADSALRGLFAVLRERLAAMAPRGIAGSTSDPLAMTALMSAGSAGSDDLCSGDHADVAAVYPSAAQRGVFVLCARLVRRTAIMAGAEAVRRSIVDTGSLADLVRLTGQCANPFIRREAVAVVSVLLRPAAASRARAEVRREALRSLASSDAPARFPHALLDLVVATLKSSTARDTAAASGAAAIAVRAASRDRLGRASLRPIDEEDSEDALAPAAPLMRMASAGAQPQRRSASGGSSAAAGPSLDASAEAAADAALGSQRLDGFAVAGLLACLASTPLHTPAAASLWSRVLAVVSTWATPGALAEAPGPDRRSAVVGSDVRRAGPKSGSEDDVSALEAIEADLEEPGAPSFAWVLGTVLEAAARLNDAVSLDTRSAGALAKWSAPLAAAEDAAVHLASLALLSASWGEGAGLAAAGEHSALDFSPAARQRIVAEVMEAVTAAASAGMACTPGAIALARGLCTTLQRSPSRRSAIPAHAAQQLVRGGLLAVTGTGASKSYPAAGRFAAASALFELAMHCPSDSFSAVSEESAASAAASAAVGAPEAAVGALLSPASVQALLTWVSGKEASRGLRLAGIDVSRTSNIAAALRLRPAGHAQLAELAVGGGTTAGGYDQSAPLPVEVDPEASIAADCGIAVNLHEAQAPEPSALVAAGAADANAADDDDLGVAGQGPTLMRSASDAGLDSSAIHSLSPEGAAAASCLRLLLLRAGASRVGATSVMKQCAAKLSAAAVVASDGDDTPEADAAYGGDGDEAEEEAEPHDGLVTIAAVAAFLVADGNHAIALVEALAGPIARAARSVAPVGASPASAFSPDAAAALSAVASPEDLARLDPASAEAISEIFRRTRRHRQAGVTSADRLPTDARGRVDLACAGAQVVEASPVGAMALSSHLRARTLEPQQFVQREAGASAPNLHGAGISSAQLSAADDPVKAGGPSMGCLFLHADFSDHAELQAASTGGFEDTLPTGLFVRGPGPSASPAAAAATSDPAEWLEDDAADPGAALWLAAAAVLGGAAQAGEESLAEGQAAADDKAATIDIPASSRRFSFAIRLPRPAVLSELRLPILLMRAKRAMPPGAFPCLHPLHGVTGVIVEAGPSLDALAVVPSSVSDELVRGTDGEQLTAAGKGSNIARCLVVPLGGTRFASAVSVVRVTLLLAPLAGAPDLATTVETSTAGAALSSVAVAKAAVLAAAGIADDPIRLKLAVAVLGVPESASQTVVAASSERVARPFALGLGLVLSACHAFPEALASMGESGAAAPLAKALLTHIADPFLGMSARAAVSQLAGADAQIAEDAAAEVLGGSDQRSPSCAALAAELVVSAANAGELRHLRTLLSIARLSASDQDHWVTPPYVRAAALAIDSLSAGGSVALAAAVGKPAAAEAEAAVEDLALGAAEAGPGATFECAALSLVCAILRTPDTAARAWTSLGRAVAPLSASGPGLTGQRESDVLPALRVLGLVSAASPGVLEADGVMQAMAGVLVGTVRMLIADPTGSISRPALLAAALGCLEDASLGLGFKTAVAPVILPALLTGLSSDAPGTDAAAASATGAKPPLRRTREIPATVQSAALSLIRRLVNNHAANQSLVSEAVVGILTDGPTSLGEFEQRLVSDAVTFRETLHAVVRHPLGADSVLSVPVVARAIEGAAGASGAEAMDGSPSAASFALLRRLQAAASATVMDNDDSTDPGSFTISSGGRRLRHIKSQYAAIPLDFDLPREGCFTAVFRIHERTHAVGFGVGRIPLIQKGKGSLSELKNVTVVTDKYDVSRFGTSTLASIEGDAKPGRMSSGDEVAIRFDMTRGVVSIRPNDSDQWIVAFRHPQFVMEQPGDTSSSTEVPAIDEAHGPLRPVVIAAIKTDVELLDFTVESAGGASQLPDSSAPLDVPSGRFDALASPGCASDSRVAALMPVPAVVRPSTATVGDVKAAVRARGGRFVWSDESGTVIRTSDPLLAVARRNAIGGESARTTAAAFAAALRAAGLPDITAVAPDPRSGNANGMPGHGDSSGADIVTLSYDVHWHAGAASAALAGLASDNAPRISARASAAGAAAAGAASAGAPASPLARTVAAASPAGMAAPVPEVAPVLRFAARGDGMARIVDLVRARLDSELATDDLKPLSGEDDEADLECPPPASFDQVRPVQWARFVSTLRAFLAVPGFGERMVSDPQCVSLLLRLRCPSMQSAALPEPDKKALVEPAWSLLPAMERLLSDSEHGAGAVDVRSAAVAGGALARMCTELGRVTGTSPLGGDDWLDSVQDRAEASYRRRQKARRERLAVESKAKGKSGHWARGTGFGYDGEGGGSSGESGRRAARAKTRTASRGDAAARLFAIIGATLGAPLRAAAGGPATSHSDRLAAITAVGPAASRLPPAITVVVASSPLVPVLRGHMRASEAEVSSKFGLYSGVYRVLTSMATEPLAAAGLVFDADGGTSLEALAKEQGAMAASFFDMEREMEGVAAAAASGGDGGDDDAKADASAMRATQAMAAAVADGVGALRAYETTRLARAGARADADSAASAAAASRGDGAASASASSGEGAGYRDEYVAMMEAGRARGANFAGEGDSYDCHKYASDMKSEQSGITRKVLTRVKKDIKQMARGLPVAWESSILLRYDKKRPYMMKAVIFGPPDTPYDSGVFVFDIYAGPSYPAKAPVCNIVNTGGGRFRFNPNLYSNGKVCLSLLGTWRGGGAAEEWSAKSSSIWQVLVSIQALILVQFPWANEPGYESQIGTPEGDHNARYADNGGYEKIRRGTVRHAMIDMLRHPPAGFEEEVRQHFRLKRRYIRRTLRRWVQDGADSETSSHVPELTASIADLETELEALGPSPCDDDDSDSVAGADGAAAASASGPPPFALTAEERAALLQLREVMPGMHDGVLLFCVRATDDVNAAMNMVFVEASDGQEAFMANHPECLELPADAIAAADEALEAGSDAGDAAAAGAAAGAAAASPAPATAAAAAKAASLAEAEAHFTHAKAAAEEHAAYMAAAEEAETEEEMEKWQTAAEEAVAAAVEAKAAGKAAMAEAEKAP